MLGMKGLAARNGFFLVVQVMQSFPELIRWPVRRALLKQLYFTGIQSIGPITFMALLTGLIMVTQVSNLVGRNELLTLQVLIWTVVRELGPLLTAIVIVGRSSSAIASELAAMQVNGEIANLQRMGISPVAYLVASRFIALTITSTALTFYFLLIAIGTGMFVTAWVIDVSFSGEVSHFFEMISALEMFAALLKGICFGMLISLVPCYFGLAVKNDMNQIPVAASRAVMGSLLAVFACDGLITVILFQT